ncbi:unnamed protein product, partial [Aureobasidium vineae]
KSFAARRVPRKIGHDDQDAMSDAFSNNDSTTTTTSSIVKRPAAKHRKSSALRPSFASDDDNDDSSTIVTPKRANLSRLAIQRNVEKRSDVAFRPGLDSTSDRPTYNKNYLDELKQSTPATPKDIASTSTTDNEDAASASSFDDFTTDGKITFGRKAQREEEQKRRAEMASMIADAEGQSADDDNEDDESEAERNAAFEVAQTRHGTYAAREQDADSTRPQTPPRVVPLPTMDNAVERLRKRLEEMEVVRANKANEMQSLVDEKSRIGEEEVRVQAALKETGEKYRKLREDMGLQAKDDDKQMTTEDATEQRPTIDRTEDSEDSDEDEEDGRPGLGTSGLGSGMRRDMSEWGM